MLVWQGDTPDSGEAAIMGVPLPHLVLPWEQLPLRGCVCQSRSSKPHLLPQIVGEGWKDEGTILWHSFVGLCRCGDGPLRPVVRYIMATPH